MNVLAWRVVPEQYAPPRYDPFDGQGSSLKGGRWNSQGVRVVYTSATLSLAILETLVHAAGELSSLLNRIMYQVTIPDELIEVVQDPLPLGWSDPALLPDVQSELRRIGDEWVRTSAKPVLRLPSAVVTTELNYVLNPLHPDFNRITKGGGLPLPIDRRLLK